MKNALNFAVPLSLHTSWRVGGAARQLYRPDSIASLQEFITQLSDNEPLLWLGLGSNSLAGDKGFNGTVILTQGGLGNITCHDTEIEVDAGVSCARMARFAARNNLQGGEFWAGIPGTMGGALAMNAGCFNAETWNYVSSVKTITRDGNIRVRKPTEFAIAYRTVAGLQADEWFVSATFALERGERERSLAMIRELLEHRALTQPTSEYNCGSVFKNPPGGYAARLIEECGLKGKTIGGAMVSEKHANFIINYSGKALATDIRNLIEHVQGVVQTNTGILLECEVKFIGEH